MKRIAMTLLAVLLLCGLLSGCIATQAAETEPAAPTVADPTESTEWIPDNTTDAKIEIEEITVETSPIILNPEIPIETIPPQNDADYSVPVSPTIATETQ